MAEADPVLKREQVSFSSDSQILSELGERLIESRQVALAELIKNAHDADAAECHIWLEDDNSVLNIKDDGHGMTEDDFANYWMTIATTHRTQNPTSRRYGREVTGSKGVGRFAVRNLGLTLELRSVAYYDQEGEYRRLVANFHWDQYESGSEIGEMTINYQIEGDATKEEEGTHLEISNLRGSWTEEDLQEVSGEVLDIVSPPYQPDPSEVTEGDGNDPGFAVYFSKPGEESPVTSAAQEIYERYVGKVEITVSGNKVTYHIQFGGEDSRSYEYALEENMIGDVEGEIRFIPQRKGVLAGLETMDGREARGWLNDNGGVRVIDKNFRVPPYGDPGNDWLSLDEWAARRNTSWNSSITEGILSGDQLAVSRSDAALSLPTTAQILGAVEVSSYRPGEQIASAPTDRLVPSMDRRGFVENDAFQQLVDVTRSGLEILGAVDAEIQKQQAVKKAEEATTETKEDIQEVRETLGEQTDIDPETQQKIESKLDEVEDSVEEKHEAELEARQAVESMNLLGAVSAFMSHETTLILDSAREMLDAWKETPSSERTELLENNIEITERAIEDFENHLQYSNALFEQLAKGETQEFKPKYQIDLIIEQFETYTTRRHIEVDNRVPEEIETPPVNLGLYSGVLTNLYTNAMKAVLEEDVGSDGRQVVFEAENTENTHKFRVLDNGSGLTEEEKERMFDPLYSTTDVEGPTGPGMGLGMYIVDQVLETVGGEIEIVEPREGFSTAIEVRLPR